MCHTERFQTLGNGVTRSWTFQTTHEEGAKRDHTQTLHFDCGDAECAIAIAWLDVRIISLKLTVFGGETLPVWPDDLDEKAILSLYENEYPHGIDGIPFELREFLLQVPTMINLINERNGDILSIESCRMEALDRSLSIASN